MTRRLALALLILAAAGPAVADAPPAKPVGYLNTGAAPDTFRVLPPAPSGASAERRADIAVYRQTRRLQGTWRWQLAAKDAVDGPAEVLACPLGAPLSPEATPGVLRLFARMARDSGQIVNAAKDQFKQPRPFVVLGGPICTEAQRAEIAKSFAYPSGHSTYIWATALVLAEIAPDRAQPIMARARAYGESRVVCGVHWASDVEQGRANASILVAALHAEPTFQADLAQARREIAAARLTAPPTGARCLAGERAAAQTPWAR